MNHATLYDESRQQGVPSNGKSPLEAGSFRFIALPPLQECRLGVRSDQLRSNQVALLGSAPMRNGASEDARGSLCVHSSPAGLSRLDELTADRPTLESVI